MKEVWNAEYSESHLEKIYQKLYRGFILEVDALDNGVDIAKELRYRIVTGLGSRIHRLNKGWNASP